MHLNVGKYLVYGSSSYPDKVEVTLKGRMKGYPIINVILIIGTHPFKCLYKH